MQNSILLGAETVDDTVCCVVVTSGVVVVVVVVVLVVVVVVEIGTYDAQAPVAFAGCTHTLYMLSKTVLEGQSNTIVIPFAHLKKIFNKFNKKIFLFSMMTTKVPEKLCTIGWHRRQIVLYCTHFFKMFY